MKWVAVMPFVYRPFMEDCVATMHPDFKKNLLFVDNTVENLGIMRSHNMGVDHVNEVGADWLIIISAAIRFGEEGGLDFIELLRTYADHQVLHAATADVAGGLQNKPEGANQSNGIFGWHLTAFHRSVFETIGRWDENFSPYSLDDIDLSLRIRKGIPDVKWNTYPCSVHDTIMSHGISKAGVKASYPARNSYFKRKWGRDGGDWQNDGYAHPFNDPINPLSYCPEPDDPLSIWQNEYKTGGWDYDD